MKKPTLSRGLERLKKAVWRFPLAAFFSLAFFTVLVCYLGNPEGLLDNHIVRLCIPLALGFVVSLAIRIFSEDQGFRGWRSCGDLFVIPLMLCYFLLLPDDRSMADPDIIRYAALVIVSLLLLCVAPFSTTKQPALLWSYNVKMWLHLALSIAFSLIFFGGFALALVAIETLFNVKINDKAYGYLAAFFFSLHAPLFFAAGIPEKTDEEKSLKYPLLRIVGEYVLLPILTTYLIILYAYGLKILFTWELPNGWLTWLILIYSGVGLLTYFLLHNLYLSKSDKLSTLFGKYFFLSEIPLIPLLFIAIFRRIGDYGITENRYFILLSSCWLLGITVYMIWTKGKTFRPVFISFAAIALLSVVGPWSAFSISAQSQLHRLEEMLSQNGLLENGKWTQKSVPTVIENSEYEEIENTIYYFTKNKKTSYLQPLLTENIDTLNNRYSAWQLTSYLLRDVEKKDGQRHSFSLSSVLEDSDAPLSIAGYDYFMNAEYSRWNNQNTTVVLTPEDNDKNYCLKITSDAVARIYHYGNLFKTLDLQALTKQILEKIDVDTTSYDTRIEAERMSITKDGCKLIFTSISGDRLAKDSLQVENARMYILFKE